MADELARLDATAQADLVRKGELTPLELVDASIARIEALNPQLNAVIHPLFEKARDAARSPDLPDGPFKGVPFLVKDVVCHTAGDPYHAGTKFLKEIGWVEESDTELARRYRAAVTSCLRYRYLVHRLSRTFARQDPPVKAEFLRPRRPKTARL